MVENIIFFVFAGTFFIHSSFCDVRPPFTSCDIIDEDCLTNIFNTAFENVVTPNNCGLESLDPLYIDEIIGDFPTLYYKNTNTTITGIREWCLKNVSLSLDLKALQFVIDAPGFRLEGISRFEGYLNTISVLGLGPFTIDYGRYEIIVYALFNLDVDENGDVFGQIGEFFLNPKILSPTNYNYSLVFGESGIITATANEIQSEDWENQAIFSGPPVIYPVVQRLFDRLNNYLKFGS